MLQGLSPGKRRIRGLSPRYLGEVPLAQLPIKARIYDIIMVRDVVAISQGDGGAYGGLRVGGLCTYRPDVDSTYSWRKNRIQVTTTTLNGAITSGAGTLVVTSAANFPTAGNFTILVDNEEMTVTAVAGTTFTVTRGANATGAAAHSNGATVTFLDTEPFVLQAAYGTYTTTNAWQGYADLGPWPGAVQFSKMFTRFGAGSHSGFSAGTAISIVSNSGTDICSSTASASDSDTGSNGQASKTTPTTIAANGHVYCNIYTYYYYLQYVLWGLHISGFAGVV